MAPHASQGTANRSPEFYIRLSDEERFGIVRMGEHKGNRVVEKLTIQPVVNETTQEPDLVEVFRQQVADELFKIWPQKPLDPGEYAVVQYSIDKVDMQVWDFFIAPGTGQYSLTRDEKFQAFSRANVPAIFLPRPLHPRCSKLLLQSRGTSSSFSIAARISAALRGSTSSAPSPATSGRHEVFDVITGTPAAMACATGNPKPSYKDG